MFNIGNQHISRIGIDFHILYHDAGDCQADEEDKVRCFTDSHLQRFGGAPENNPEDLFLQVKT